MDIIEKEITCSTCHQILYFTFTYPKQKIENMCGCWNHYIATLNEDNNINIEIIPLYKHCAQ